MVRKKTIYKIIKYGMIIIACIIAFKTIFLDFKPEYLISWNAFSNWWIDTYAGLFKMILSIILGITLILGIGWLLWKWLYLLYNIFPDVISSLNTSNLNFLRTTHDKQSLNGCQKTEHLRKCSVFYFPFPKKCRNSATKP